MSQNIVVTGDMILQEGRSGRTLDKDTLAIFGSADLRLGNLEGPVTTGGFPADKAKAFRMPPESVEFLQEYGFDVVTRANNHALDYGIRGLRDTTSILEYHGIGHCGAGETLAAATEPFRAEVGHLSVAILSFCSALPSGYAATAERPGVAPIRIHQAYHVDGVQAEEQPGMAPYVFTWPEERDLQRALTLVAAVREKADLVIVCIHWGVPPMWMAPFQGTLANYQQPLGRQIIDAGADLIVGHHAHTLHGIEVYKGRPILYSVGNFLYQKARLEYSPESYRPAPLSPRDVRRPTELMESAVFNVALHEGKISGITMYPIMIDGNGLARRANFDAEQRIIDRVQDHSALIAPDGPMVDAHGHLDVDPTW